MPSSALECVICGVQSAVPEASGHAPLPLTPHRPGPRCPSPHTRPGPIAPRPTPAWAPLPLTPRRPGPRCPSPHTRPGPVALALHGPGLCPRSTPARAPHRLLVWQQTPGGLYCCALPAGGSGQWVWSGRALNYSLCV